MRRSEQRLARHETLPNLKKARSERMGWAMQCSASREEQPARDGAVANWGRWAYRSGGVGEQGRHLLLPRGDRFHGAEIG